jgi:hypothetical protein
MNLLRLSAVIAVFAIYFLADAQERTPPKGYEDDGVSRSIEIVFWLKGCPRAEEGVIASVQNPWLFRWFPDQGQSKGQI